MADKTGHGKQLVPSTLVWTYENILKPKLTYAAVVWRKRIKRRTAEATLEQAADTSLRINCLAKKRTVELLCIPGHNGIRSSDIANDLVKLEAGQRLTDFKTAVGIF